MLNYKLISLGMLFSLCSTAMAQKQILCLATLAPKSPAQALVEHKSAEDDSTAQKMWEWSRWTSVDKNSPVAQCNSELQRFEDMIQKKSLFKGDYLAWRTRTDFKLFELRDSEEKLKAALREIALMIHKESADLAKLPPKNQESETSNPPDPYEQALSLRLTTLQQIQKGLASSLADTYKVYLILRNKLDLDHPYYHNPALMESPFSTDFFSFDRVNRGLTPHKGADGWEVVNTQDYTQNRKGDQLYAVTSLSLPTMQALSALSRAARIQKLTLPLSDWSHLSTALTQFKRLGENPSSLIGQTLTLDQLPKPFSPPGSFKVVSFNATQKSILLSHPSAGSMAMELANLLRAQLQAALLRDLRAHIQRDKPSLVIVRQDSKSDLEKDSIVFPYLVTKVSQSDSYIYVIPISEATGTSREATGRWVSMGLVEGIPWVPSQSLLRFVGAPHSTQIVPWPAKLPRVNGGPAGAFWMATQGQPFDPSNVPSQHLTTNTVLAKNHSEEAPGFIEKMEGLRVHFETNGFIGERTIAFLSMTLDENYYLKTSTEQLETLLRELHNFQAPSWWAQLIYIPEHRKNNFNEALKALPEALSKARWFIKHPLDGTSEATVLMKEIVETLQKYQTSWPELKKSYENQTALAQDLNTYFEERILLFSKLARSIADTQATLNKNRANLVKVILQAEAAATQFSLPPIEEKPYLVRDGFHFELGPSFVKEKLRAMMYEPGVAAAAKRFLTSDVNTHRKEFMATPHDFKRTLAFTKRIKAIAAVDETNTEWSETFDFSEFSGYSSHKLTVKKGPGKKFILTFNDNHDSDIREFEYFHNIITYLKDNFLIFVIAKEFESFMKAHGGLYNPVNHHLYFSFSPRNSASVFNGIDAQGHLVALHWFEAGFFWETLDRTWSLRDEATPYQVYLGRGLTLFDEAYYVSRGVQQNSEFNYFVQKLNPKTTSARTLEPGVPFAATQIKAGSHYLLLPSNFKETLHAFLETLDNNWYYSHPAIIDISSLMGPTSWGQPVARSDQGGLIFQHIKPLEVFDLFPNEFELSADEIPTYQAIESLGLDQEIPNEVSMQIKKLDEVAPIKKPRILLQVVRLPKTIYPEGAFVVKVQVKETRRTPDSRATYLILDQELPLKDLK